MKIFFAYGMYVWTKIKCANMACVNLAFFIFLCLQASRIFFCKRYVLSVGMIDTMRTVSITIASNWVRQHIKTHGNPHTYCNTVVRSLCNIDGPFRFVCWLYIHCHLIQFQTIALKQIFRKFLHLIVNTWYQNNLISIVLDSGK